MAFVHDESCECIKSELDLFTVPSTQTSIEQGQWVEYHPIAKFSDGGPIEFHVAGSGSEYLDLAQSQILVKFKVTKKDGSNLAEDDQVGPVNLFLHSLFSQVDASLNDRVITPSTPTYPYRAMLETLLQYGPEAKQTQLTALLYYKDTSGEMDQADPTAAGEGVNAGLKKNDTHFASYSKVFKWLAHSTATCCFSQHISWTAWISASNSSGARRILPHVRDCQCGVQDRASGVRPLRQKSHGFSLGHVETREGARKRNGQVPRPPRRVQTSLGTSRRNVFAARPRVLGTDTSAYHHRLRGQQSIQRQLHPQSLQLSKLWRQLHRPLGRRNASSLQAAHALFRGHGWGQLRKSLPNALLRNGWNVQGCGKWHHSTGLRSGIRAIRVRPQSRPLFRTALQPEENREPKARGALQDASPQGNQHRHLRWVWQHLGNRQGSQRPLWLHRVTMNTCEINHILKTEDKGDLRRRVPFRSATFHIRSSPIGLCHQPRYERQSGLSLGLRLLRWEGQCRVFFRARVNHRAHPVSFLSWNRTLSGSWNGTSVSCRGIFPSYEYF